MTTIEIDLPGELLSSLTLNRVALSGLAREALLVRLYDLGEVSSGKAAELLGSRGGRFSIFWASMVFRPLTRRATSIQT